jgi:uncharacterized protein (DUF1501 family)
MTSKPLHETNCPCHGPLPQTTRRAALQAGSLGLLGLSMSDVFALRAAAATSVVPEKSVIFVFLTGGLSHQDSFDLKPEAPDTVRGEFRPIATRTPGIQISEHLPLLAQRSENFALVRSMATNSNGHEEACHMLLTGRLDFPPGFSLNKVPSLNEWPSLAAQVTYATRGRKALPPAVVLPQPSVNEMGRVRPGQYAGRMGPDFDAWHLDVAAPCPLGNGACPHCFRFEGTQFEHAAKTIFETPRLSLPESARERFANRVGLLANIERQQVELEDYADVVKYDRQRQRALSVLTDANVRAAFDVEQADPRTLERYGRNKFGLSLLMAARLVAAGVNLVQVNLGKNSSWDTHRGNFVNLKNNLLPYLDRAVSGLLDDLAESGLLDTTLVVVTGEFGRTPKINRDAGRDHWGPAMTSFFAGGGVRGGNVIGSTDKIAAYPTSTPYTPENLAATIYQTLGIPRTADWHDVDGRPHQLYHGAVIDRLM